MSFVFVLLFILSFSFEHEFIPDAGSYFTSFFEQLAAWTGKIFFNLPSDVMYAIESDTTGFYLNALNLLVISFLLSIVWSLADKKRTNYEQLAYWFFAFIRFYLAMQLFSYGFNKIFKWQFYAPEPNTLYTAIGNVPNDFLYWSSMGTSRLYVIFSGMAEIVGAALLLFRRTYIAGAIVSLLVMINVLMINFGFNISVKLYSLFLVMLCMLLVIRQGKKLAAFFFSGKTASLEYQYPEFSKRASRIFLLLKIMIIAIIILDPLSLYIRTGNYNDDHDPRPPLHGAYEVKLFVKNSDTLLPLTTDTYRWRRMFVHRRGYLITQQMNDEMISYQSAVDTTRRKLMIDNENTHCFLDYSQTNDSTLNINGIFFGDTLHLELKKIDLKKLPLLQDDFKWTIDQ
ncbi:MAG: hypothetical protein ABIQ40_16485 [Bacteroidia bacterium]